MLLRVVLCCCVLTVGIQAQTDRPSAFDIVSVKPNKSGGRGGGAALRPGRFDGTNLTLRQLIIQAYDIPESRVIGGEPWMSNERFDVAARSEQSVSRQATQGMARRLLEDRFQLKVSTETRVLRTYTLTVATAGSKLKTASSEGQGDMSQGAVQGTYRVSARRMPLSVLMPLLEKELGAPVRDETRLEGLFDFDVEWVPALNGNADASSPSVFSAIQEQLGLRLEAGKGPVEVLVIAHAARPSEN